MKLSNVTPNSRHQFTSDTTLNIILQQETKEKEENPPEITKQQQREETLGKSMCRQSKEILKEEKCFACDKKNEQKGDLETVKP